MKIGIDARILTSYVKNLINQVVKKDKDNDYVLFFDQRIPRKKAKSLVKGLKNVDIKYFPFSQYRKFIRYAYSQILVSAFLAKERLDVLHATAGNLPLTYKGRIVLNLWRLEKSKKERLLQKRICKKADKIIVPTQKLKRQIKKAYKIKPMKIIVSNKPNKQVYLKCNFI